MNKKKPKQTLGQKMKNMFSFICTKGQEVETPPQQKKNTNKKPIIYIKKEPRQTLNLQNAFLKISRKNVVEEQFVTHDLLSLQLERHLSRRLQNQTFVLIKGQFTFETTKKIPFPIHVMNYLQKSQLEEKRQRILSQETPTFRNGVIDAILYQTYASYSNEFGKVKMDEIDEIEVVLKKYHKSVKNLILICSQNVNLEELDALLMVFCEYYIYEVEKIKMNEKVIAYTLYISDGPQFLKLNQKWFKIYLSQQILGLDYKNQCIQQILQSLLKQRFHKEILNIVRLLKWKKVQKNQMYYSFLQTLSERYPDTKSVLKPYLKKEEEDLYKPTPLFGQDIKDQQQKPEQLVRISYQGTFF